MEKTICVLGSANSDSFAYLPHIPAPGETIQADKHLIANGGKGANQAVAAGRLGVKTIFSGQVGNDSQMQKLKKQLQQSGVTINWKVLDNVTTGKAIIYVDQNHGQNSIVIIGGANTHYQNLTQLPEIFKQSIDKCQVLQLQKQIPSQINVLAAKYAKSKGKIVMLDCGGRDDDITEDLLSSLDYISPNQTQLLRIDPNIDISNPTQEIRKKLISKYPNLKVVLKLGTKGSNVITNDLQIHTDIVSKINKQLNQHYKVIDTVGAGDCFTSAFCVKLLQLDWTNKQNFQQNYRKCLIFGNSSAFLCITKKGAMPSMPQRKLVDQIIQKYNLFKKQ